MTRGKGWPLISVEGLKKRYGAQQVLDGVTFLVEPGAVTAVIGQNGCGKSTLLSIMAAMLRPDEGSIQLDGIDPFAQPAIRRKIGYVPQGDVLFEELTVRDNLSFWASAAKLPKTAAEQSPFVKLLGLHAFLHKKVSDLSGGMRRRAAICACLLGDPAYILLDEPFSGLDLVYRQELTAFLLTLRRAGKTLVYSTHSPEELVSLSDSTMLLSGGRIVFHRPTASLTQQSDDIQQIFLSYLRGEES